MISLRQAILPIVASVFLIACDQTSDTVDEVPLRLVRTVKIMPFDADNWRSFSGLVEASRKAELSFRVPGKLKQLAVKEGDRVQKDQLLAQLDSSDYDIQLASRKAEYDKAEADFQRAKKLVTTGTISRSDYEKLKSQRETAQAGFAAAQQNVAYTSLRAPFAGRIARRYVDNFEEVRALQQIYALQDPTAITIRIDIPESIMINTRESAKPEVYAEFSQLPERRFPLTVKEVSTQADAQTNTFAVSFTMPAVEELNILPGMSVTVYAKPDRQRQGAQSMVYIPSHAVLEDKDGRFVYLVKRQGGNRGVIEKRPVVVGELSKAGLAITDGLQTGDEVVSAGMSKMSVGLEVRLSTEGAR